MTTKPPTMAEKLVHLADEVSPPPPKKGSTKTGTYGHQLAKAFMERKKQIEMEPNEDTDRELEELENMETC